MNRKDGRAAKQSGRLIELLASSRDKAWASIAKILASDPALSEAVFSDNSMLDALLSVVFVPTASKTDVAQAFDLLGRFAKSAHWARIGPHALVQLIELPTFVARCAALTLESFCFDELLGAVQITAVSDNNKPILGNTKMVKFLLSFLNSKTAPSRCVELAASALLELSFHPDVKAILADSSLDSERIVRESIEQSSGAAKHNATQLLWAVEHKGAPGKGLVIQQHVMFSYSWAHQSIVVKIARSLQRDGFPVWLDVDQMKGNTAEAMAEAVEQASVVVICLSTAYKESANCRLEADYALKLRKPLVFLQMQKEFLPSGWLGMMLGSQMYYEFIDESPSGLTRSLTHLKKELEARSVPRIGDRGGVPAAMPMHVMVAPAPGSARSGGGGGGRGAGEEAGEGKTLLAMTVDDVVAWCQAHSLAEIASSVRESSLDGRALCQLLKCVDLNSLPSIALLQSHLSLPTFGAALRFALEIQSEFYLLR